MSGSVEWAILIFMGAIALGSMGVAWRARGILAENEAKIAAMDSKFGQVISALSRDIMDRNHLLKYDLADQSLRADLDHLKNNFKQHQAAANDLYMHEHDQGMKILFEVDRLSRIVNGKH